MRKNWIALLLAAVCFLSGCVVRTVDEMYCLPKRSEEHNNLQSAINKAMVGMEYSAPLSGEHQQTVQTADLNGDGEAEYLLFAKSSGEKPLQILIFSQSEDGYVLSQTIESNGSAFDLVEYVQMDDKSGMELVVGRQVSDQVLRSVCVYTFSGGQAEMLVSANYTKFLTCNLDDDSLYELMVLRPGTMESDKGIAELYGMENGVMERSNEAVMSASVDKLKRIITGRLHGGQSAVFAASSVEENAIITDVYAVVNGVFTNVSLSNDSGTSVQTLRNYYVYADDIDSDGEVELPSLIAMTPVEQGKSADRQYLIRWYAMASDGTTADKMYTYHNFVGGWYMELEQTLVARISVVQENGGYVFCLWNENYTATQKLFTVSAHTGADREEQALSDGRFLLYKSESTVYTARLEEAAEGAGITPEALINGFHLVRQAWKTGEM